MKYSFFVCLFSMVLLSSCNNDDGGPSIEVVPPRLLAEVAPENDEEIKEFLDTHFYNYEEFEAPPAGFDFRITIDTIAGENADKKPLSDFVRSSVVKVSSSEHPALTEEETDVPHTLYYLSARPTLDELDDIRSAGNCDECFPTVADSVYVRYEGKLLNGTSFDASLNNPVWFDLAQLQNLAQGFRGFAEGIPNFKKGNAIIDNGDGTVTVDEYGVGLIIFPSGLANFNRAQGQIPQYDPLMFNIDLFTLNRTDHDNDGIPSIDEDVNGNGYLYDDNTDLQSEIDGGFTLRFADFLDADDDGDGVSTKNEISDDNGNIIGPPYPDSNNDGTPDYLDSDVN
ncbi:FKBP-type peptidyl-prolyl cis-trans isomerase [Flagellimonas pacifica]|uniref:peptidylprolyl isomerase n=1 Tax=Flagellimonas pacifica TaxID=1247520 RepID=A0A285MZP6_9FLAO|nr:FKBP-type peptidyl-prolyl cis-trans isomerase [Allomuricauda parva]SNZ02027.1 FKBP-type peptidyl-prolyl cis-trans isomerase [Allomuricauda parva]